MNKMSFRNKEKNQSALQSLAQALGNRDKSVINTGSVVAPSQKREDDNILGGAGELLGGGAKLLNGLNDSGLFSKPETVPEQYKFLSNTDFGKTPTDGTLFGGYNLGGANAGQGTLQTSEMPTFSGFGETGAASAAGSMSPMGWLSIGQGLFNGVNQGFNHEGKDILGGFGNGVQGFFGVNENDSDVQQGIKGTLDGAMKGTMIFPGVGTVIGALLGLGSSFLDDI